MQEIVLATHNPGKAAELATLMAPLGFSLLSLSEFGIAAPDETGLTFFENALIKARHASLHTGLPALAEDSGLCVEFLHGAPGLNSARYAGEQASNQHNISKLLEELRDVSDEFRDAYFYCSLVFLRAPRDPAPLLAEGRWNGRILNYPQGHGGFGYDPIFYSPEHGCSAAELPPELKNTASHRGQAVARLLRQLGSAL